MLTCTPEVGTDGKCCVLWACALVLAESMRGCKPGAVAEPPAEQDGGQGAQALRALCLSPGAPVLVEASPLGPVPTYLLSYLSVLPRESIQASLPLAKEGKKKEKLVQ